MSNNLSNSNTIMAGIKEVGHKVFGGYAELLRIPHTARYSIGSVIACMPFPMVGMTITISVQHYYGNYSLAGMLTAIQAIALAVATPLLGKLTDKFGQRQVSIPTILVWIVAAVALFLQAIEIEVVHAAHLLVLPDQHGVSLEEVGNVLGLLIFAVGDHILVELALSQNLVCGQIGRASCRERV